MSRKKLISFNDGENSEAFSFEKKPDGSVDCQMGKSSKEKTDASKPSKRSQASLESIWADITGGVFPREPVEVMHLTSRHGALKHFDAVIHHDFVCLVDDQRLSNSQLKRLGKKYLAHRDELVKLIQEFDKIEGFDG
jgi:hypothetical protein